MADLWVTRLRRAGFAEELIHRIYDKYGALPEAIIVALETDDGLCGLDPLTLGSDPACKTHDAEMLLDKLGYPVASTVQTQIQFAASITSGAIFGAWAVVKAPLFIVVGTVIGGLMMTVRHIVNARDKEMALEG